MLGLHQPTWMDHMNHYNKSREMRSVLFCKTSLSNVPSHHTPRHTLPRCLARLNFRPYVQSTCPHIPRWRPQHSLPSSAPWTVQADLAIGLRSVLSYQANTHNQQKKGLQFLVFKLSNFHKVMVYKLNILKYIMALNLNILTNTDRNVIMTT